MLLMSMTDRAEAYVGPHNHPVSWFPHESEVPARCIVEVASAWLEAHGMPECSLAKVLGTNGLYLMDLTECRTLTSAKLTTNHEGVTLVDARLSPVHLVLETPADTVLLILHGLDVQGFVLRACFKL